jgi:hypothetical protein
MADAFIESVAFSSQLSVNSLAPLEEECVFPQS